MAGLFQRKNSEKRSQNVQYDGGTTADVVVIQQCELHYNFTCFLYALIIKKSFSHILIRVICDSMLSVFNYKRYYLDQLYITSMILSRFYLLMFVCLSALAPERVRS